MEKGLSSKVVLYLADISVEIVADNTFVVSQCRMIDKFQFMYMLGHQRITYRTVLRLSDESNIVIYRIIYGIDITFSDILSFKLQESSDVINSINSRCLLPIMSNYSIYGSRNYHPHESLESPHTNEKCG